MVFCIQNSAFSTRIASLYVSEPSSVVLAFKTATLGPELQVSMGTRPHLSFCACKTTCLASEILDSMGPSPHLWFLHAKSDFRARITSLNESQTSPVVLCMQNNEISIRKTSPYVSQPSSVVFACKTAPLGPELQVSMGPRPHLCFLHSKQRL